jgi:NitT/TauT family transport system ATP-binding protein
MMPESGVNPIPDCQMTWVFGLLETLEDRGGRDDGYKIARDLQFKFSDLLKVMKTAEILGFVSTPDGDVVLEPLGKKFIESDINQRKLIVREQLKKHGLFAYLMRLLRAQEDRSLSKEVGPEKMFSTVVNWGRFAELFGYNKDEDRFYLDHDE